MADLKRKEVEKAETKEAKRIERERKKKIREEKQLKRERKKAVRAEKQLKMKRLVSSGRKTKSRKNSAQEKGCNGVIAALHLLSSSSVEDGDSQSVALGMAIALKNGSVVMGVACGSTISVQT